MTVVDRCELLFHQCCARAMSMNLRRRRFLKLSGAAALLGTITAPAKAQAYPARPVRVIVPFAPIKDFAPVTLAVASTAVFSVNPAVPARTMDELVALIRANPGKMSYASGGTGTQPHLAAEQLRLSLNLDLVHVPFNGGAPA